MSSDEHRSQERRARRRARREGRRARGEEMRQQLQETRDAHLISETIRVEEEYADQLSALSEAGHQPSIYGEYVTGEYGGLYFRFRCERCFGYAPVGFRRPLRLLLEKPCKPQQ